jgi:5-methylcytosine-specific restriction endonuclease McrA
LGFENITMQRSRSLPRCKRRTIPRRLKIKILLRQEGRCADCGTPMIALCVFDHRPPLALRDIDANPNDPKLLAAICHPCNKRKTFRDLRAIARARRAARSASKNETPAHHSSGLGTRPILPGQDAPPLWPRPSASFEESFSDVAPT